MWLAAWGALPVDARHPLQCTRDGRRVGRGYLRMLFQNPEAHRAARVCEEA